MGIDAPGDHFDGRRFFNPTHKNGQPVSAVPRMLVEKRTAWPASVPVEPRRPPPLDGAAAGVTLIRHAPLLTQTQFGSILTDPVYSQRASPVPFAGPKRVRQPAVLFGDLPPITV